MKIFKVNDKLPNICCQGFDWTIIDIIKEVHTCWGKCENPNCPLTRKNIWDKVSSVYFTTRAGQLGEILGQHEIRE